MSHALAEIFAPAPSKGPLSNYRLLAPNAGLRVSPLCLGAMSFGTNWAAFMGACSKEESFKILDTYYEHGGNFVDTANNYQEGQSEEWIGEWMAAKKIRHEIVVATKYTTILNKNADIRINHCGNHKKSLHISVEQSLQRLKTDYIDILYLHWWDYTTPVEEIMQALNALVVSGKVLYLGISDCPAWVVVAANCYAKSQGFAQFVVYQGRWNASQREMEREIIPMCKSLGLGIAPWNVMHGGKFARLPEQNKDAEGRGAENLTNAKDQKVLDAIVTVSKELNATLAQVAIAYVMKKYPFTYPIIGGKKASYLPDNIKALELNLTDAHVQAIEAASDFEPGFPHDMLGSGVNPTFGLVMMSGKLVVPSKY